MPDNNEEEEANKDSLIESNIIVNNKDKNGWSPLQITVEPIMFLINFVTTFTGGIKIDLLQQNVCHQNFNLTIEDCSKSLPKDIKSEIESMTADVNMWNSQIEGIFPVVLVLCIGPWSDINGRKPFLLRAVGGFTLFYFLWGVLSLFPKIPVMCFIIPAIPLSLSGGWISILVCCQSYIADTWNQDIRPFRISINIFLSVCGGMLANAVSAPIFYATGSVAYQVMFFSSCALCILGHFYIQYCLKETIIRKGKKTRLLDFAHLKNVSSVLFLKPIKGHLITFLTLIILTTEITSWVGEGNFTYLIGKSAFNWTLGQYNMYNAIKTALSAFSPMTGMWLLKNRLKLHSYTILTISSCSMCLFNTLKGFAVTETMYWIVSVLLRMSSFIGPCIDTELSLLVTENNIGKAFAFSSMLDAISPIVSLPLFNSIYKATLPDNTLKTFLVAASLSSITAVSSITLLWNRKRTHNSRAIEGNAIELSSNQD